MRSSDVLVRLHGDRQLVAPPLPERPRWLARRIEAADLSVGSWALLSALWTVAPIAGVLASLVWSVPFGLVLVSVLVAGPAVALWRWRRRRQQRLSAGLPESLELIARALRTGHSLRQGVGLAAQGQTGPATSTFQQFDAAIERGLPMRDAFVQLGTTTTSPDLASTSALLAMIADGARGAAPAIEAGSNALRQRAAVRDEVRALIAQAETSLRLVAALPFAFVGLGFLSGQAGALALFTTPIGRICLVLGALLEAIGMLWMNVLVTKALR